MTKDKIISMALEAGFERILPSSDDWICFTEELERFAELVAAAEREACAHLCDKLDENFWNETGTYKGGYGDNIRSMGQT